MRTVPMISMRDHIYGSRTIQKDEWFDCEERFVALIAGLGRARVASDEERGTRAMHAVDSSDLKNENEPLKANMVPQARKPRGNSAGKKGNSRAGYQRRDLRSKD